METLRSTFGELGRVRLVSKYWVVFIGILLGQLEFFFKLLGSVCKQEEGITGVGSD